MEPITYAWLAVGLVPYHIAKRYPTRHTRTVTLRALFWTLDIRTTRTPVGAGRLRRGRRDFQSPGRDRRRVHRPAPRTAWTLHIPLIERLRDAVWAAVLRLKGPDQPPAA